MDIKLDGGEKQMLKAIGIGGQHLRTTPGRHRQRDGGG
jgi:hypothetical protein